MTSGQAASCGGVFDALEGARASDGCRDHSDAHLTGVYRLDIILLFV